MLYLAICRSAASLTCSFLATLLWWSALLHCGTCNTVSASCNRLCLRNRNERSKVAVTEVQLWQLQTPPLWISTITFRQTMVALILLGWNSMLIDLLRCTNPLPILWCPFMYQHWLRHIFPTAVANAPRTRQLHELLLRMFSWWAHKGT